MVKKLIKKIQNKKWVKFFKVWYWFCCTMPITCMQQYYISTVQFIIIYRWYNLITLQLYAGAYVNQYFNYQNSSNTLLYDKLVLHIPYTMQRYILTNQVFLYLVVKIVLVNSIQQTKVILNACLHVPLIDLMSAYHGILYKAVHQCLPYTYRQCFVVGLVYTTVC